MVWHHNADNDSTFSRKSINGFPSTYLYMYQLTVCGSAWVRNLVSDIKGGTQTEGVWEQGAEEDNWTDKEDEMDRACSTNGGEEECIYYIGGKTRRKETTRKTKT
jgi:hypothetical protein